MVEVAAITPMAPVDSVPAHITAPQSATSPPPVVAARIAVAFGASTLTAGASPYPVATTADPPLLVATKPAFSRPSALTAAPDPVVALVVEAITP